MMIGMSRRWLAGLALGLAGLGAAGPAHASRITRPAPERPLEAAPVPPAAPVVATVDLEEVIKGLKEREDKEKALKGTQDDYQKRVNDLADEAKNAKSKLENMPDGPDKIAMAKTVREKLIRAEFEKQYAERVLAEMKGEMLRELYNKINDAVQKVAKQNGYQLVLTSDAKVQVNPGDPDSILRAIALKRILYVDPSMDITNDIIQYLNNQYAAGPAAGSTRKP
ncbi:MAG TPA: OmpH family outer membrane protein [Phycisphaerales bacterium]|nr:OmpH family outer membrane protein [Phycisphaerales bacterium]